MIVQPTTLIREAALDAAKTLVLIAKVSRAAGQTSQAKSMMSYALRTIRATLGDNHPDVAAVLNSMSSLCIEVGMPRTTHSACALPTALVHSSHYGV